MRVLFLTNFYLVHGSGGEEQSCQQVVQALRQRGHTTLVLTSMHGSYNSPVETDGVHRALYLEMDLVPLRHSITFFTRRKAREEHNLRIFESVVQRFEPDIIFIWGMWNLPYSLPAFAEDRYPNKVVYRFATYWPTLPSQHEAYWRAPARNWYSRLPKQVLGHVALAMLDKETLKMPWAFRHAICVSTAVRNVLIDAGLPVSNARIIHTGLDVKRYWRSEDENSLRQEDPNLNMLYAGRMYQEKGLDTLIQSMNRLVHDQGRREVRLSLAGSGSVDYIDHLHQLVNQAGLADYISFLGWVPPEEMPGLLRRFDVLLLPSIWPEPFSRAVLEGMISGLVVVATRVGGTPEIITNGKNGVLFTANDSEDLANCIALLADDPESRHEMGIAARKTILERFTMTKMMAEIEGYLQEVVSGSTNEPTGQLEFVQNRT